MAVQLSIAVRNARLDATESTIGTSAKLQFRTGTQPASCATASSGTMLVEMTLPSDYMAAASSGTKALLGSWTGTAAASGTAAHWRLLDSAGTTCHAQGTITGTGGGGDLTVDNTSIASGQTVTQSTFTLTDGNA